MSEIQEDSQSASISIDNENNAVLFATRQINNVIDCQEPSTSKNYPFQSRNIHATNQISTNSSDNSFPPSQEDNNEVKRESIEIHLNSSVGEPDRLLSRSDQADRARYEGEPPPPYEHPPPPSYWGPYRLGYAHPAHPAQRPSRRRRNDMDLHYSEVRATFHEIAKRNAFVRKVFCTLFIQLLITCAIISLAMFHEPTKKFIREQFLILFILNMMFFTCYLSLMCFKSLRRNFPVNYIFLLLITISLSYLSAYLTTRYDTKIIVTAAAGTGIICLLVALLALQTWLDITQWHFIITIAGIILLLFGLLAIILFFLGYTILWIIFSALAVVLFSVYLLYDMQCILGGKRVELSSKEYIYGALTLYVDVVYIFWYLLHVLAFTSR